MTNDIPDDTIGWFSSLWRALKYDSVIAIETEYYAGYVEGFSYAFYLFGERNRDIEYIRTFMEDNADEWSYGAREGFSDAVCALDNGSDENATLLSFRRKT